MAEASIIAWLKRKRRTELALSLLSSLLAVVTGALALLLTFCLLYVLVLFLGRIALGGQPLVMACCLGVTLLLALFGFLDNARASREDLEPPGRWLLREVLYIGPRLITSGLSSGQRAARLAALDIPTCAQVLAHLARCHRAASKSEVMEAVPTLVWPEVVTQLGLIEGVLFFRADLSRITLTEPLRRELRPFLADQPPAKAAEAEASPTAAVEPGTLSYYEILGVSSSASPAEIKAAYRNRIKECHPDRFPGLNAETRQYAEEWSKAINAAYAALLAEPPDSHRRD